MLWRPALSSVSLNGWPEHEPYVQHKLDICMAGHSFRKINDRSKLPFQALCSFEQCKHSIVCHRAQETHTRRVALISFIQLYRNSDGKFLKGGHKYETSGVYLSWADFESARFTGLQDWERLCSNVFDSLQVSKRPNSVSVMYHTSFLKWLATC